LQSKALASSLGFLADLTNAGVQLVGLITAAACVTLTNTTPKSTTIKACTCSAATATVTFPPAKNYSRQTDPPEAAFHANFEANTLDQSRAIESKIACAKN
jgi:hypothetical protein